MFQELQAYNVIGAVVCGAVHGGYAEDVVKGRNSREKTI
jgi:hypothetical protein